MRKWSFLFLCLALIVGLPRAARAAELVTASITFTNFPTNHQTITVQGSTRTWTNASVSTSPNTLIQQTNSIPYSATNLINHLTAYTAGAGHFLFMANPTNVSLRGRVGEAMAVSATAGYALITYTTQQVASPTIIVRQPYTVDQTSNQIFVASWSAKHLTLSTNPIDGVRLTNIIGFNGTVTRATNGYFTNQFIDAPAITNGYAQGTRLTNIVALHGTNHLLSGGTIESATLTNATITNVNNLHGLLLGLTNGVLTGPRITNAIAINGAVHYLTNGYYTNSILDNALLTNAIAYHGFSSYGTNAAGSIVTSSLRLGAGAIATNTSATAVGNDSLAGGEFTVALGKQAYATNSSAIAIGVGSAAGGLQSIAIGDEAYALRTNAIAIGSAAQADYQHSIALGWGATTTQEGQIMLGHSANVSLVTAAGRIAAASITNALITGTNIFRGDVAWEEVSVSTLANGNNIAAPATNKFMRLVASGPTAAFAICGIQGGRSGRELIVWNDSGQAMTFAHESGIDPTPANRIYSTSQGDVAMGTNSIATLIYSAAKSRWVISSTTLTNNPSLANNSVTDGILRDSAALSVIGRSANSAGDPADISSAANGQTLVRTNDTLAWGKIAITNSSIWNANPVAQTNNQVLAWDAASNIWTNKTRRTKQNIIFWQGVTALSPADSTTYFVGSTYNAAIGTTYAATAAPAPCTGTITGVAIAVDVAGTLGTTEDVNHYVRVNDAADSAAVPIDYDAARKTATSSSLSVPVTEGQLVALKIVTPAWATNPTTVRVWACITITED